MEYSFWDYHQLFIIQMISSLIVAFAWTIGLKRGLPQWRIVLETIVLILLWIVTIGSSFWYSQEPPRETMINYEVFWIALIMVLWSAKAYTQLSIHDDSSLDTLEEEQVSSRPS